MLLYGYIVVVVEVDRFEKVNIGEKKMERMEVVEQLK